MSYLGKVCDRIKIGYRKGINQAIKFQNKK